MKFLFFTDLHIKGVNPGKRKDVFYLAVLKKLMEIGHVIKNEKIDFVMIGGDLFDLPKISNQLLGEVAKVMKSWKTRVFIVPGNHDVYGQNISTLPHTSLGILERTGVVTILTRDISPFYIGKRNDQDYPLVGFTGQEYYQEIDTGVNNDYEIEHSTADYNVLIAHGMLLDKPFHPDIAFTLMQNVQTGADLVLSGHYHPDEIDVTYGSTRFIKPRGAARLEATKHNMTHMPQYVIVDISKQNGVITTDCDIRDFTWAPQGADIFDYDANVEAKLYKDNLKAFKEQIRSIDLTQAVDLPKMVKTIAQSDAGITVEHIECALKQLIASEKNSGDQAVAGFVEDTNDVYIKDVIIESFQSHEKTEISFSQGSLNALVGESNNGKTAIMRAINWCLYNEPKGNDFIKDGEKAVSVTIKMSNGFNITRRRTNSDTGYYEIEDTNIGQTKRYAKFGMSIPIEVMNAHQMPKVTIAKEAMSLNVAKQLDGAFMLSMSGSDRAAAIGKITKTDVVDNAIAETSKGIVNLQRSVKSHEKDLEALALKVSAFDYLNEEENLLIQVENIITDINTERKLGESYAELRKQYNNMLIETNMAKLTLDKSPDTDSVQKLIDKITIVEDSIKKYQSIRDLNHVVEDGIVKSQAIIDQSANTDEVNVMISKIESEKDKLADYIAIDKSYKSNSTSIKKGLAYVSNIKMIDDAVVTDIEDAIIELERLKNKKAFYDNLVASMTHTDSLIAQEETLISSQENIIQSTQKEYKEVLLEVGKCPICGNTLDEHTHFDL